MEYNCSISQDDIFFYFIKDKETTIDYFGEDYLEEYGKNISNELLQEYKIAYENWLSVQAKIRKEIGER